MKNRKTMATTELPMRKKEMVSPMESYLSDINRSASQGAQEGGLVGRLAGPIQESLPGVGAGATNRNPYVKEGMQGVAQNFVNERLNSIPFKNSSINVFDKKRYDISREFDGQEVPGSLTVRPTLFGGTVETERFDFPGAGTSTSRTRKNAEGQPVRRIVKDKKINQ